MALIKHFCIFAALWHAGASIAISKSAQSESVLVKHEHISDPFPARVTWDGQHVLRPRGQSEHVRSPGSPTKKDSQHSERVSPKRDHSGKVRTDYDEKSKTESELMPPPPPRTPGSSHSHPSAKPAIGRPVQEFATGYPADSISGKSWETFNQYPIRRYAQLKRPRIDSKLDLHPRSALESASTGPAHPSLIRRGNVLSKPLISDDIEINEALLASEKEHYGSFEDSDNTAQQPDQDEDMGIQPTVNKSLTRSHYYYPIGRKRRGVWKIPMIEKHELRMFLDSLRSPETESSAVKSDVYSGLSRAQERQPDPTAIPNDSNLISSKDHEDEENDDSRPPSYESLFQKRDRVLPRGLPTGRQGLGRGQPSPVQFSNNHRDLPADFLGHAGDQSFTRDPVGEAALRDAAQRARQATLYPPIDHRLMGGRLTPPPPPPRRSSGHSDTFYPPLRPSIRPGLANGIIDHRLSRTSSRTQLSSPPGSPR